jgi:poly-beta-1,6-N-acetyl-D-glucosamine synthase
MAVIVIITVTIIALYFLYPLYLHTFFTVDIKDDREQSEINGVSLILLACNGKKYLKEKIAFLLDELSSFQQYELIIIDDSSTDGTIDLLSTYQGKDHVRVIVKEKQEGIPNSMNMGVGMAQYPCIVFCDQRQKLSGKIIKKIVDPLKYDNVGAVSGCISHLDKDSNFSLIRRYENLLKVLESNLGCLIGVYGPFFAIKKQSYEHIPEDIILDDLYLSLRIMRTKNVLMRLDCKIYDDNFSALYGYKRVRRYLSGFLQILNDKTLIRELNTKQRMMLIWHKYLRLVFPTFLFLCYFSLALRIAVDEFYMLSFILISALLIFSLLPDKFTVRCRFKNIVRLNIFYFFALPDILIRKLFLKRKKTFFKPQPA